MAEPVRHLREIQRGGAVLRIGDRLPLPPPVARAIVPARNADDPARNARGLFRNGRGKS